MKIILMIGGVMFATLLDVSVGFFAVFFLSDLFGYSIEWQWCVLGSLIALSPDIDCVFKFSKSRA